MKIFNQEENLKLKCFWVLHFTYHTQNYNEANLRLEYMSSFRSSLGCFIWLQGLWTPGLKALTRASSTGQGKGASTALTLLFSASTQDGKVLVRRAGISRLCLPYGYHLTLHFPGMSNTKALLYSEQKAGVGPRQADSSSADRHTRSRIPSKEVSVLASGTPDNQVVCWAYSWGVNASKPQLQRPIAS